MTKKQVINKTAKYVKEQLAGESSGHDWWHVYRVWQNAIHIGKKEQVDMFVVELAALLHDLDDWKMTGGDPDAYIPKVTNWLNKMAVSDADIDHILRIIKDLSFKGHRERSIMLTKEGEVVQDADRLEGLGAIGIARAIATGQKFGQEIHNPHIKPMLNQSSDQYKKQYTGERKNTTINHFYEKLLLLADLMNTKTARKIARKRHRIMEDYLDTFFKEWEGLS